MDRASERRIVERFAEALDMERYGELPALLSPACEYRVRGDVFRGVEAIIASYRAASTWAASAFDSIAYESSVHAGPDGLWTVRFVDLTEHRGLRHRHECEQCVRLDADGLIASIDHVDLPGERERLDRYLHEVGVSRPASPARPPGATTDER